MADNSSRSVPASFYTTDDGKKITLLAKEISRKFEGERPEPSQFPDHEPIYHHEPSTSNATPGILKYAGSDPIGGAAAHISIEDGHLIIHFTPIQDDTPPPIWTSEKPIEVTVMTGDSIGTWSKLS